MTWAVATSPTPRRCATSAGARRGCVPVRPRGSPCRPARSASPAPRSCCFARVASPSANRRRRPASASTTAQRLLDSGASIITIPIFPPSPACSCWTVVVGRGVLQANPHPRRRDDPRPPAARALRDEADDCPRGARPDRVRFPGRPSRGDEPVVRPRTSRGSRTRALRYPQPSSLTGRESHHAPPRPVGYPPTTRRSTSRPRTRAGPTRGPESTSFEPVAAPCGPPPPSRHGAGASARQRTRASPVTEHTSPLPEGAADPSANRRRPSVVVPNTAGQIKTGARLTELFGTSGPGAGPRAVRRARTSTR